MAKNSAIEDGFHRNPTTRISPATVTVGVGIWQQALNTLLLYTQTHHTYTTMPLELSNEEPRCCLALISYIIEIKSDTISSFYLSIYLRLIAPLQGEA